MPAGFVYIYGDRFGQPLARATFSDDSRHLRRPAGTVLGAFGFGMTVQYNGSYRGPNGTFFYPGAFLKRQRRRWPGFTGKRPVSKRTAF